MVEKIVNYSIIALCLSIIGSVFVHETYVDRATLAAAAAPAAMLASAADVGQKHLTGEPHTHVERVSIHEAMRHVNGKAPTIPPRNREGRREQKKLFGRHYDNAYVPLGI